MNKGSEKETAQMQQVSLTGLRKSEERRRNAESGQTTELTRWQRFVAFFRNGRTRLAIGVIMLLMGVYLLISFLSYFISAGAADQNRVLSHTISENAEAPAQIQNAGAAVGAGISEFFISDGVGIAAFFIVAWCLVIGYRMVRKQDDDNRRVDFFMFSFVILFSTFACSMLLGFIMNLIGHEPFFFPLGGYFGKVANASIYNYTGIFGMIAVAIIIGMIWGMLCWSFVSKMVDASKRLKRSMADAIWSGRNVGEDDDDDLPMPVQNDTFLGDNRDAESDTSERKKNKKGLKRSKPKTKPVADEDDSFTPAVMNDVEQARRLSNPHDPTGEYMHYRFPTLDLMQNIEVRNDSVDIEEQEMNKRRITETLNNYGIQIKQIEVSVGPTVTLFEIVPQDGVRVSKIRGLEDDIALSLAALGIRIIAPMPGRGTIGIEVPNRDPQVVPMRQVLGSKKFQETKMRLPMVLGCTVSNEVFVADLAKMPHLLVAGATGQGKSVGLNCIITSLLYKKGPSELKFVLVDPKKVEFSLYADLEKYFLAKVPDEDQVIVTSTDRVVRVLNSLVEEMENRYNILESVKVRNVEDYNDKWRKKLRYEKDENGDYYQFMPYVVAIVDEFSDLIMTAGKEVERPIVLIAQKARAVGIHMIIATQRPSSNVITGLIKANFPGRMAFRVTQMIDSRIILDRPGAQQLIGRGDMLFSAGGEITRLQCPFVDTPDVERVCQFIKEQEDADTNINHESAFLLPEARGGDGGDSDFGGGGGGGDRDPLFEEVARYVVQSDKASTSNIQRRWSIGYNRAGRIMDQLEDAGIVGPASGGKPRSVLIDPAALDQMI